MLILLPSWRSNKWDVKLSQERNLKCFGCTHRSGIIRSYGNSSSCYFLSHCTYVHDGYSQYVRVPLYLHPCQHFFIHWFVHIAILTRVSWNLIIVLIFISLMTKNVIEHFSKYLSVIFNFFFWGFCSKWCPLFGLCCLFSWWSVFWVLYVCQILILCQKYSWQRFFSYSVGFLFIRQMTYFAV